MIDKGASVGDLSAQIDDAPALRGLQTMRAEVRHSLGSDSPLSKARVIADLRAAIGYGGMIHEYKNYVLGHELPRVAKVESYISQVRATIEQYHQLGTSRAENVALEDIDTVLLSYSKNLKAISDLIAKGHSNTEIDQAIKIDDKPALRGLHILDREIVLQVTARGDEVSRVLDTVNSVLGLSTWGIIGLLLFVAALAQWLMQQRIIRPVLRLNKIMARLADNDFTVKLDEYYRDNELGDMARTVTVFRENMIERDEAEMRLEDANNELNTQLDNIHLLREQSEEQTTKALSLAEGLASARESAEKAMALAEQDELLVRSILNAVHDAIITIDTQGIMENVNPGAEQIFGYRADELLGNNVSMLMPEPVHSEHDGYLARLGEGNPQRKLSDPAEQMALHKDGSTFMVEITLNTMMINDEKKIIGVVRDITERKKWEEEIERLAMTDPLTGLANRNHFNLRLEEAAALSRRSNQPFALMLLDLDKFKPVNDTYGHPVGDALLAHVGKSLVSCCREIDTVARLGGDEFAVILLSTEEGLNCDVPAQRIIETLSQSVIIDGHSISIGASIGISSYPTCSSTLEELQRQADAVLYLAKEEGRNTYRIFKRELAYS